MSINGNDTWKSQKVNLYVDYNFGRRLEKDLHRGLVTRVCIGVATAATFAPVRQTLAHLRTRVCCEGTAANCVITQMIPR